VSFHSSYGPHRDLHSFPTRRSSDLLRHRSEDFERALNDGKFETLLKYIHVKKDTPVYCFLISATSHGNDTFARQLENLMKKYFRSEEHTSELQSRFDLVCRLLLEKK